MPALSEKQRRGATWARRRGAAAAATRAAWALGALLLLAAPPAGADRISSLTTSLTGDPSWRVKVQAAITLGKLNSREPRTIRALVEALKDDSEAVRAVAAETIGKLGDASAVAALQAALNDESAGVKAQAQKAIAAIQSGGAGGGSGGSGGGTGAKDARWLVELSDVAPGKFPPEAAQKVHDRAARALGEIAGVTIDPAASGPKARYLVDGTLANLTVAPPDANGRVRTSCAVRMVLSTMPDHSIKMMATLESNLDGNNDPKDIEAARNDCLVDTAKQIAEKVQNFLDSHR